MGAAGLDDVIAGLSGASRSRRESPHDLADSGLIQFVRNRVLREEDRAGGQRLSALQDTGTHALHLGTLQKDPRFASAVPNLDTRQGPVGMDRLHQAALAGNLLIRP